MVAEITVDTPATSLGVAGTMIKVDPMIPDDTLKLIQ